MGALSKRLSKRANEYALYAFSENGLLFLVDPHYRLGQLDASFQRGMSKRYEGDMKARPSTRKSSKRFLVRILTSERGDRNALERVRTVRRTL